MKIFSFILVAFICAIILGFVMLTLIAIVIVVMFVGTIIIRALK
ncbi:hypothetical protein [Clostridium butyricum]